MQTTNKAVGHDSQDILTDEQGEEVQPPRLPGAASSGTATWREPSGLEEGMILQLADLSIQGYSPNAANILGLDAITEANLSQWFEQVVDGEGVLLPRTAIPAIATLNSGTPHHNVVLGFLHPSRGWVWLVFNTQPLLQGEESLPFGVITRFQVVPETVMDQAAPPTLQENERSPQPLLIQDSELQDSETIQLDSSAQTTNSPSDAIQFTALFENAVDAMLIADDRGQYVEANPAACQLLGVSKDELLNRTIADFTEPSFDFAQAWEQFQTQGQMSGEFRIRRPDGAVRDVEFSAKANFLPNRHLSILRDISERVRLNTERKRIEVALQESEQRYRILTEISPQVVWISDPDGQIMYANQYWLDYSGLTLEDSLGEGWIASLHPDDCQQVATSYRNALQSGTFYSIEGRLRRTDGEYRWHLATALPLRDETGKILYWLGVCTDIHSVKQSEAALQQRESELRLLTEGLPQQLWTADATGQVNYLNQRWQHYTGISIEVLLNSGWASIVHPDDLLRVTSRWERSVQTGEDYQVEARLLGQDGCYRWFLGQARALRDEQGKILKWFGTNTDISDRKEAEKALQESEERFRQLAENITESVFWICDLNRQEFLYLSPAWERIWGRRSTQAYRTVTEWIATIHPEDQSQVETRFLGQVSLGCYDEEYRILRPDNSVRWVRDRGFLIRNQLGQPYRVVGLAEDITTSKWAEDAILRSEQHVRRVLDSLFSFVGVMTPTGILIEANRTALVAASLSPEDVIGKPFEETYWWAYDAVIQEQLRQAIRQARQGETVRYDVQVRLSEAHFITIDFALVPLFDAVGNVEYLIPSGIDITERKRTEAELRENEAKLRRLVDSNIIGIIYADAERILEANQAFLDMVGYTQTDLEAGGIDWFAMTPSEYLPLDRQAMEESIRKGACSPFEKEFFRKDGSRVPILLGSAVIQAEPCQWVCFVVDLTHTKQLEQELRRQTRELANANRLKDEFLTVLSHELRTPLNPILGWAKLLQTRQFSPEKVREGLATIERNAKLQTQLVEDLLDISRMIRGKFALNLAPISLEIPVRSAIETVRLAAGAKSIQIMADLSPVGSLLGDGNRLQQVVWNLLSNAIKFTPEGGQIQVKLVRGDHGMMGGSDENASVQPLAVPAYAQIIVADTGKGINPEFLPHVFELFRQQDGSITRRFGGLGLGLALVRQIVEAHGGTVYAESCGEDLGATFVVNLPLLTTTTETSTSASATPIRFDLTGRKILVVDDDSDSLDLVATILQQEGATVTSVTSAAEVLQLLAQFSFDLLVSDVGMPEMDGLTLIRQVRAMPQQQNIPAIALTAYAGEHYQTQALNAGFQQHLPKPVTPSVLLGAIAQLLKAGE